MTMLPRAAATSQQSVQPLMAPLPVTIQTVPAIRPRAQQVLRFPMQEDSASRSCRVVEESDPPYSQQQMRPTPTPAPGSTDDRLLQLMRKQSHHFLGPNISFFSSSPNHLLWLSEAHIVKGKRVLKRPKQSKLTSDINDQSRHLLHKPQ